MKIILAGNKIRGIKCLEAINEKYDVVGVFGHKRTNSQNEFIEKAKILGLNVFQPSDINNSDSVHKIKELKPDIVILAGYGPIVKSDVIDIPKYGCWNLHGGKLPKYRGSSPLNWALINGEKKFSISIIQVDTGVDTGDLLMEKSFPINYSDNIYSLHQIANETFPKLLIKCLKKLNDGSLKHKAQDAEKSSYFPLRFPDDGFIVFDQYTAEQIYNIVRALSPPYPCAFSYYENKKILITKSKMTKRPVYGEPGRIYRISKQNGILVAAKDKCLWLSEMINDEGEMLQKRIFTRYEKFATIKQASLEFYENK